MFATLYSIAPRSVQIIIDRMLPVSSYIVEEPTAIALPCKVFNIY